MRHFNDLDDALRSTLPEANRKLTTQLRAERVGPVAHNIEVVGRPKTVETELGL